MPESSSYPRANTSRPPKDAERVDPNEEFKDLVPLPRANTTNPGMRTDGRPESRRVKTDKTPIGEMARTVIEGMLLPGQSTEYPDNGSSRKGSSTKSSSTHKPGAAANTSRPPVNATLIDINREYDGCRVTKAPSTQPTGVQTIRTPTEKNPLGEMRRTHVEGMLVPGQKAEYGGSKTESAPNSRPSGSTKLHGMTAESQVHTQRSIPAPKSFAPPRAISTLTKPKDAEMASKQTKYDSLSRAEKSQQDSWVAQKHKQFAPCPQQWPFKRVEDGYQCEGGYHFQCDELIAEGKGGMWMVPNHLDGDFNTRWGPYYAEAERPKCFFYSGPDPIPDCAPYTLNDNGKEYYEDYRARLLNDRAGSTSQSSSRPQIRQPSQGQSKSGQ